VRAKRVDTTGGILYGYRIKCPACGSHTLPVGGQTPGPKWDFNGNQDLPSFRPSLLVRRGHFITGEDPANCKKCKEAPGTCVICHSFITNGQIEFLGDCTHEFAGQTMDLPEIEDEDSGDGNS